MPEIKVINDSGKKWGSLSMGEKFLVGWRQLGIPGTLHELETEYKFHPTRKWRWDVAFPRLRIGIDFQGFGFGHQAKWSMRNDNEKSNAAAALGWKTFKYESSMLSSVKLPALIQEVVDAMSPEGSIWCKECGNIYVPEESDEEAEDIDPFEEYHQERLTQDE